MATMKQDTEIECEEHGIPKQKSKQKLSDETAIEREEHGSPLANLNDAETSPYTNTTTRNIYIDGCVIFSQTAINASTTRHNPNSPTQKQLDSIHDIVLDDKMPPVSGPVASAATGTFPGYNVSSFIGDHRYPPPIPPSTNAGRTQASRTLDNVGDSINDAHAMQAALLDEDPMNLDAGFSPVHDSLPHVGWKQSGQSYLSAPNAYEDTASALAAAAPPAPVSHADFQASVAFIMSLRRVDDEPASFDLSLVSPAANLQTPDVAYPLRDPEHQVTSCDSLDAPLACLHLAPPRYLSNAQANARWGLNKDPSSAAAQGLSRYASADLAAPSALASARPLPPSSRDLAGTEPSSAEPIGRPGLSLLAETSSQPSFSAPAPSRAVSGVLNIAVLPAPQVSASLAASASGERISQLGVPRGSLALPVAVPLAFSLLVERQPVSERLDFPPLKIEARRKSHTPPNYVTPRDEFMLRLWLDERVVPGLRDAERDSIALERNVSQLLATIDARI